MDVKVLIYHYRVSTYHPDIKWWRQAIRDARFTYLLVLKRQEPQSLGELGAHY